MRSASRKFASRACLVAAGACLFIAAVFSVLGRNLFLPGRFADHTANSLRDPGVAAFVGDRIASEIVARKPELIGARPLILVSVTGVVGSRPFRAIARRVSLRVHQAIFSENSRNIVLSVPDLDVIVRGALSQGSPDLAQKIPRGLTTKLADFSTSRQLELVVDLWRVGRKLRWLALAAIIAGPLLLVLSIWVASERQRTLFHCGITVGITGFVVALVLPAGRIMAASRVDDPLVQGALDGVLSTYLGNLRLWAVLFIGLGVLFTAAASALLETLSATQPVRRFLATVLRTPDSPLVGVARGLGLLAFGILLISFPRPVLQGAVMVLGTLVTLIAVREIFKLILASMPVLPTTSPEARSRAMLWRTTLVLGLAATGAVAWAVTRNPAAQVTVAPIQNCNGDPELCDRRVDQVVFAASHNSMSNVKISDWMFPHHMEAIPEQLEDGIRALLLDVHRGFPGAARIKTDLDGEKLTYEKLELVLGVEGVAAATRIRNRLVGVDHDHPKLYLCHGFCELGAYEFTETLGDVRDFLIANPDEVLIMVLEDYVTIEELTAAFEASDLRELVYTGPSEPWPTLRQLIETGQRLIVFIESGNPGAAWLRPTLGNIQETPYTFYNPSEFSSTPGRGGTQGSLFQLNHWIQTTPAPKPENATLVNSRRVLGDRVRRCAAERGRLPNIIGVDFYSIGDLFAVVDSLNGVGSAALP